MKKLLSVLFIGCICAFAACNSGNNSNSVDSAQNINDSMLPDSNSMNNDTTSMSTAPVSQEDADWAAKVANANMTEIELSKVAQDKATSQRLKDFAGMMVTDHTKAGDQLKQLAATKNITARRRRWRDARGPSFAGRTAFGSQRRGARPGQKANGG